MRDAERLLFSKEMLQFMRKKNYKFKGDYIEVVLNWRRLSDERGISQLKRSKYNYEMLNFLLDDLMPWHRFVIFIMLVYYDYWLIIQEFERC